MVVCQSRDAALAGVAILDGGGNAIDAAVGTALALAAVEPWNSGLGGVGFALVHRAGQACAETIDFGPVAPLAFDPALFKLTGEAKRDLFTWPEVEGDVNIHGPNAFAVPAAVAGYAHLHGRFGALPLRDVMAPAIALARRGLPQDWFTTLKIANAAAVLRLYPSSSAIYLPGGLPPVAPYQGVPGTMPLGALANTLDHLAFAGLRDFYEGDIAATIIADIAAMGGALGVEDMRHCEARIVPVEDCTLDGRTVQVAGGLTAGPSLRRVLTHMASARRSPSPDATWFAALARALKAEYGERLRTAGAAEPIEACTTHLSVCDEAGTMVSMTTTLLSSMGSRVVLPTSGVLMNNGMMWFDPRPGRPNSAAPSRRPLTNMCPVIVREGASPVLAVGASGGRRILAAVAQTLAFMSDFTMEPDGVAHHPRIDVSDPETVTVDRRLGAEIVDALRADGPVELVEHGVLPVNFACPSLLLQRGGLRTGISDVMSPWSAAVAQL